MKTFFNPADADEIRQRLSSLAPSSPRQWGRMDPAQMLAHCVAAMQMTLGEVNPPRVFIGRILGPIAKGRFINSPAPLSHNAPTATELVVANARDFDAERTKLLTLIDRFTAGGPSAATTRPHAFFGPLSPDEWGRLAWKHLDHHLHQFGA